MDTQILSTLDFVSETNADRKTQDNQTEDVPALTSFNNNRRLWRLIFSGLGDALGGWSTYKTHYRWFLLTTTFVLVLGAGLVVVNPKLFYRTQVNNLKQIALQNQIAKDYADLKTPAMNLCSLKDSEATQKFLRDFFDAYPRIPAPHKGILLLDNEKLVFGAYSPCMDDKGKELLGNIYRRIPFRDSKWSTHKIISLYRTNPAHPMGQRGTEIAFPVMREKQVIGWLIFQMDMDVLRDQYATQENTLRHLKF